MGRCVKLDSFLQEFKTLSSPNGVITTSYWYDNIRTQQVTYGKYCIIVVHELKEVLDKLQLFNDENLVELNEKEALEEFNDFSNQLKVNKRRRAVTQKRYPY